MAVKQTACRYCDLDIENLSPYRKGEWMDRGGNTRCQYGPNEGKPHAPIRASHAGFGKRAKRNPASGNRSEVRSPTSTRSEVRSPTSTRTATKADTRGNITVTGGAGRGATSVTIRRNPARIPMFATHFSASEATRKRALGFVASMNKSKRRTVRKNSILDVVNAFNVANDVATRATHAGFGKGRTKRNPAHKARKLRPGESIRGPYVGVETSPNGVTWRHVAGFTGTDQKTARYRAEQYARAMHKLHPHMWFRTEH